MAKKKIKPVAPLKFDQPVEEEKFYVGLPEDTPPVPYKNGWPLPCEDGAFGCYYGGD